MNEQRFGNEIKGLLNQGLDMTPAQLARLARAREQALAHQRVSMLARLGIAPSAVPAWAGRAFGPLGVIGGAHWLIRWMLPLAIVVAAAVGYQQYQAAQQADEESPFTEIDAELLKSELPIDAYLDRGFKQWLKGERE